MKKLLLTTASILALGLATPAMAEEPVYTDTNESTIMQSGDATDGGNGGSADVTQVATGTTGLGANVSGITQIGDGNLAGVDQVAGATGSNKSTIDQTGESNVAGVGQGRSATVNGSPVTGLPSGYSYSNTDSIAFGDDATGADNTSDIDQTGDSNLAGVNQYGGSGTNGSTVSQNGNSNMALVGQSSGGAINDSTIAQGAEGTPADGNFASVTQGATDANTADNTSTVSQYGSENDAIVAQSGTIGSNLSNVTQNGEGGYAGVTQTSNQ